MSLKLENTGGGVYRLHLNDQAAVGIKVPDEVAADELIRGLRDQFDGPTYGDVWRIASVLVGAGASVPAWRIYYQQIQKVYIGRTPNNVFFRDTALTSVEQRRQTLWKHVEAGQLVSIFRYVPEEVQLPQFFEGRIFADFRPFRTAITRDQIDKRCIIDFVLKSFSSARVWENQPDLDTGCINCLRQIGFIVDQENFTADEWLSYVNMELARSILKGAGIASKRTLFENIAILRSAEFQNPGLVADSMRTMSPQTRLSAYRPPDDWGWDDFQSIRQQLKGIATMLVDIYDGGVATNKPGDFTILTARVAK